MTFEETYLYWIDRKSRLVKPSTMAAYVLAAENHLLPFFGAKDVSRIGRKDVQTFVDEKLDKGLCAKTVKDILIVLKMIVRYAEEEFEIAVITQWRIEWPSDNISAQKELQRYTPQEVERIIEAAIAKPSPLKMSILLTLTTGMRIGEVCALQFKDIDLERKVVKVRKTLERIYHYGNGTNGKRGKTELIFSSPKTQSSNRDIPIMGKVLPLLRKFAALSTPDYYLITMSEHHCEPRTFAHSYHRFILEEVGLKRSIKFHGLRHTFASTLIENKVDVKTVSSLLGHSDISTTLNVYVHPSEEMKRNAINGALKRVFK